VAAAERAIIAAGHVPVDMTDFPAADRAPAGLWVQDSMLSTRSFASPDTLQLLVERSLLGIITAHDQSGLLSALDT
jgi:hypothetical protein